MDKVFKGLIGQNVKVYVNNMVVKSEFCVRHVEDLDEVFVSLRRSNMRLNPKKCIFGVDDIKLIDFILTHRGIGVNPDKQVVIEMRSLKNLKNVRGRDR